MFYQSHSVLLTYYFLAFGIAFFFAFPLYQRQYYKNHYDRFIAENYKTRFGQTSAVAFGEEVIATSDITGETKINLTEVESTTETGNYFYLKLRAGGHLIIPKYKLNNVNEVREELKKICSRLMISFIEDLDWTWK
jgi:hypothetical protein